MSAHCNVLCYAFSSVFVLFHLEGVQLFFFYINISLTEVKYHKKKVSFSREKNTCHGKTTSFMYEKTKGMILTFFWELRCCTRWINWILKMSDFKEFFLQIKKTMARSQLLAISFEFFCVSVCVCSYFRLDCNRFNVNSGSFKGTHYLIPTKPRHLQQSYLDIWTNLENVDNIWN